MPQQPVQRGAFLPEAIARSPKEATQLLRGSGRRAGESAAERQAHLRPLPPAPPPSPGAPPQKQALRLL